MNTANYIDPIRSLNGKHQ